MKTIKVSPRARTVNALLRQALRENLILRTAEGREFVLAEVSDFDREIDLTRHHDGLMQLLDRRGKEKATTSLDEARAQRGLR